MQRNILLLFFFFTLFKNVSTLFKGRLCGIDTLPTKPLFVQISDNSSNYKPLFTLGDAVFTGPLSAMKSFKNENYIVAYQLFNSSGDISYHMFTIDVRNKPKLISNRKVVGPGVGSFMEMTDDVKQIIVLRESEDSYASLEVAVFDLATTKIKRIGYYPYGQYPLVMAYAPKRRLYYNIVEDMFYGMNVDTGKLVIKIPVGNDYLPYSLLYDSVTDRLITLVYSNSVAGNAWFLAKIIIDTDSSKMTYERIGKAEIPMGEKYSWSGTYTVALKERQWLTLWSIEVDKKYTNVFIAFDIDTGEILEEKTMNDATWLANLVYFD